MNEITKQLFARIYLDKITSDNFVDWAIDCLEEGLDTKSLRLLAGLDKNHPIEADFNELFRKSLDELGWKYLGEKEVLLDHAQNLAKKILSGELDPIKGSEQIHQIYIQLHFPDELQYWRYLDDGHLSEWFDKVWWIPFMQKYNHKNWLEAVMREAKKLSETVFVKELEK
ncbi:MAG TPA: hypothetical protein PKY82_04810 [Pyrinomonadaceae bacterium]|nr:hypothetical protein [Pyrinomonadaceae bacterium]